ncbi:threonine-phosphate decarboxylase CobD [Bacillota bacterium LX-D]|nr:threonine-phosphate decarboxylase CobD [Bacillota bacterium LX-D]
MNASVPEHGGNLEWAKSRFKVEKFIDFSANINPLGCPPRVFETIKDSLDLIMHYPDPDSRKLKQKLEKYFRIEQNQIIVGNGAVELLYLICHLLKPQKILTLAPSFSEYVRGAETIKAQIEYYYLHSEDNFNIDLLELDKKLSGIDLFFLCNPNNPTGTILNYKKMRQIQSLCLKHQTFLVVDESFIDFIGDKEEYSVRHDLAQNNKLFILHSLTKFFALPGLRLGCGFGSPDIISKLIKLKDPWSVNALAQTAGIAAIDDSTFQAKTIEYVNTEKDFLFTRLNEIKGLKAFCPSVNFVLVQITGEITSDELVNRMAEKGVLIRNCKTFPGLGDKYIRVAVRTREENLRLLIELNNIL